MLDCFQNIVTIRGACSDEISASSLLINDVGISIDEIDSIITKDYPDAVSFFNQKRDFAIKQIIANIHSNFQDKYKTTSLITGGRIGFTNENTLPIAGEANTLKGIELELCNTDSFVDIFISSLSLYSDFTGNVDVKVYDLFENKLIDTITIAAIANKNITVYPNKTYKSNRKQADIIFVYDTTLIGSIKTTIGKQGCRDCGSSGESYTQINRYLRARSIGINSSIDKIKSNTIGNSDTGGLSIEYSLQCNHEEWLCTISNSMGMPILYKTASEIMEFALHATNRINSETILDFDKIKERLELYDLRFRETMTNLLGNIMLPQDEKCFYCNQKTKNVIILP